MNDRYCPCCNMFKDVCLFDELKDGKLSKVCMTCAENRKSKPARVAALHVPPPRPIPSPVRSMHMNSTREFPGVDIDRVHHLRGAVKRVKR